AGEESLGADRASQHLLEVGLDLHPLPHDVLDPALERLPRETSRFEKSLLVPLQRDRLCGEGEARALGLLGRIAIEVVLSRQEAEELQHGLWVAAIRVPEPSGRGPLNAYSMVVEPGDGEHSPGVRA